MAEIDHSGGGPPQRLERHSQSVTSFLYKRKFSNSPQNFSFLSFLFFIVIIDTSLSLSHPKSAMHAVQAPTLGTSPLEPLRGGRASRFPSAAVSPRRVTFVRASAATVSAPKREKDPKKRVVITGTGLVSVFGNDVNVFYEKLLAGESGITPIDRFDASKFPTRFGGQIRGFSSEGFIDGKNDRRLDDCLRYCIVAGKKALVDADLGGDKLSKVRDFLNLLFRSFSDLMRL